MNLYIDIETIPTQKPEYLLDLIDAMKKDFKAPSGLTKKQACTDLGVDDQSKDWKYKTKDDCVAAWVEEFAETKAPEIAEQEWRKTSFDGGKGELISVAWAVDDEQVCGLFRTLDDSESGFIRAALLDIADMMKRNDSNVTQPFLIGHNVTFDLQFLFKRCVILGIKPPFRLPFDGRHGSDYYCTMAAWEGFKGRISQDNLCAALGLPGKPDGIDGSKVWDAVKAGEYDRVLDYNKDDVEKVRAIHRRLTFAPTPEINEELEF